MNPERLLAHYETIADAPDAIPRLRRFVLDLAVRGKLVPQDPNDEPASELLKRIAAEKARLVKAGEIKREKSVARTSADDLSFDLPAGWSFASLSEVAACLDHRRIPVNSTEREARIASKSREELFPYYGATQQQGWIDDYLFDGEFILLGEDGVPFGDPFRTKAYLISGKSWVNNHAHVFQAILTSPQFLVHYLNVFDYSGRVVGTTRAKLNQAQAVTIPCPIPPLAEQHRIVAKVDELMALIDRLEAARAEREATRDRLTAASLARLNAPDPETFRDDARFALDALPALTARADQIKQFRQTILNLAVRGKLVPQDPNDEPASELLKRIAAEKARLVKDGKIRTPRAIPALPELPYPIPANWRWSQLAEIGVLSPRNEAPDALEASFVPMSLIPAEYGVANHHEVRRWGEIKKGYTHLAEGDVGLAKITPCFENGKSAVFRNLTGGIGAGTTELHVVRPLFVDQDYILLFLKSPHFIETGIPKMTGTAGQKRVPFEYFAYSPFPLPPLAEQRRIVAKVDELMALCDRLETSLATADDTRRRLLEALLAEALAPAEDRELEAAE
ncbi:type I restriction enzyme S subunit [Tepidamorphus gemmatus]|uniref:Type I restriction enzyme S subunit n=1 Tax=Tepidamorphus gemmatus TaxID=747076 RepID=A0A4R3M0C6_9HYPH|nr:restriction endonuclease subunit S [Tepidamorphus gemmatus]TCT04527.1 type I restriction enzyme S subunit [Tepidamorphus gemmatus]